MNRGGVFLASIDVVAEQQSSWWAVYYTLLWTSTVRRGSVVWSMLSSHDVLTDPELLTQLATNRADIFVLLQSLNDARSFFADEERRCVVRCWMRSCG